MLILSCTVDSRKVEHGCRLIHAGFILLLFGVGGGHVSSVWLLRYTGSRAHIQDQIKEAELYEGP